MKSMVFRSIGFQILFLIFIGAGVTQAQPPAEKADAARSIAANQALPAPVDPVVVTVGDQKITAGEFERLFGSLPATQQRQFQGPAGRRDFVDYLVRLLTLASAAEKEKLERDPRLASQLRLTRLQVLAFGEQQAILNRASVSEEEIQKFYNQNKDRFLQLHLLHISVPFATAELTAEDTRRIRKEMDDLRQRAMKGEDFSQLARAYSKDSDVAKGGDLGFIGRGKFGETVDNLVFRLKPGQVSSVIETPGALHIFKVLDGRPQPLADACEAIVEILKNQMLQFSVPALVREARLELNEAYFNDPSAAPIGSMPITVDVMKNGKVVGKSVQTLTLASPAEKKK